MGHDAFGLIHVQTGLEEGAQVIEDRQLPMPLAELVQTLPQGFVGLMKGPFRLASGGDVPTHSEEGPFSSP